MKLKKGKNVILVPGMGTFRRTFSDEQEEELVAYIKDLDSRLMLVHVICLLSLGIFSYLDFLPLVELDFSDSQLTGTAFPDAKGDCTPVFDPELSPATSRSELLQSPENLPIASTSQSPLQMFTASSLQSLTEPLLRQTDLLNRTPKHCNLHQLTRALTESSRQIPPVSYKKH
jgi:hypothetical protein